MVYHKELVKIKVKSRLNDIFIGIIQDIPSSEFNPISNVVCEKKNNIMTYESFYNVLYRCVLEYIPIHNENPLLKSIKMAPRVIKNIQNIKCNVEIVKFQKKILGKYFYFSGDSNIKEKLSELEKNVNQLIEEDELEILEDVLLRFDDRIRSGLLADLEYLTHLLDKRA